MATALRACSLLLILVIVSASTRPAMPDHTAYAYAAQHHPTSTHNAAAQLCFDRGLTLFYAYNRRAARRAFECAAKADSTFAMAYWGIALAYGSNINVTVDQAGERAAYAAVQRALALDASASVAEQGYIRALASRYSNKPKPNLGALAISYKNAMGTLMRRYPEDPDAAALYVEALMELQPWQLYAPGGAPVGHTNEIVATLESVLVRVPEHIGANHFYIHAVEGSNDPQRGLMSAGRLQAMQFEPGAAHLVHMPAHIYMRTGDFARAAEVNEHASMHDVTYQRAAGEPDDEFKWAYHDHNLSMLAAAYSDEGNWVDAERVVGTLTKEGALVPAMFVYLRFGRWDQILNLAKPEGNSNEPLRLPIWHFARGMAYATGGRIVQATSELNTVRKEQKELNIPAWPGTWNSSSSLLQIASDVLAAKIAAADGNAAQAVALLREAVTAQDNLLYIEPPDWYFPVREALGGTLFASGDYAQAEQVFRADLQRNARNPRSLFGLYHCLTAQGDDANGAWVLEQFNTAWKHGDITLKMSSL